MLHLQSDRERRFVDVIGSIDKDVYELQADDYAQNALVSEQQWYDLINDFVPLNDDKILEFSMKHRINPAIILGRACFEMNYYAIRSTIDKTLN